MSARTAYRLLAIVLGGLLAGAIGFVAGGFIGIKTCDWNIKEAGCILDTAYGVIIGGSILMPFGTHLASLRRGHLNSLLLALLASVGIAVVGLALFIFANDLTEWIIVAIPIVQLICCATIGAVTIGDRSSLIASSPHS